MSIKRISNVIMVLMLAAFLLPSCSNSEAEETKSEPKILVKQVVVEKPQQKLLGLTINEGVTLAPEERGIITSQVTAKLTKWHVQENQYVKAGSPIASLDPTDYQISLEQARLSHAAIQAQFSSVEKDFVRIEALLEKGGVAQSKFDGIKGQRDALQAQIKAAAENVTLLQRKVRQATPRAPFDGVITGKIVPLGKYVMATMPGGGDIATIEKIDRLKVSFSVSEMYFSEVNEKDEINLFVPTLNKKISVPIDSKGKSISGLKTFSIISYIENKDLELPAGVFAVATIKTVPKKRTIISPTAVKITGNRIGEVYTVEAGKVKAVSVIIGFSFEEGTEILGDIPERIIKDVSNINVGETVTPIEA